MSYQDWVDGNWTLTTATPAIGATEFGLSTPGTLRFDGTGNVNFNTTPWGKNCVFSSDSTIPGIVIETVMGTHIATEQPFTITRTVGEISQSGEVYHTSHHGTGSGCGVWTANDG